MSVTILPDPKFEQRHYEAIHCEILAPAIGKVGIEGTQKHGLERLKKRRKTELQSTLAEGIKPEQVRSVIDTHYPIEAVDGKLVAEDGEAIENMLERALVADKKLAAEDEFFAPFLVKQTQSEIDELHEWEAMVRGETDYNTVITFSGYREEHDDGTKEAHNNLKRAGQKPYWRRGMFRVAHAQDGQVHVFNYSIDNCSAGLMAEVARRELGYEFQVNDSTGMLGERIHQQVNDDSWRLIAPRLVAAGDKILGEKYGGVWKHGYKPTDGVRRAQAFVESQTQIVDSLIDIDQQLATKHPTFEAYCSAFEAELYNCMALLEKRLDKGREREPIVDYGAASSGAGSVARSEGKVYDACGLVINGGQAKQAASAADKTGLESLKRLENKKINCIACKKEVKIPKKDLNKGVLSCSACGYWLDVCTGRKGFNEGNKKISNRFFSALDIIAAAFQRAGAELRLNNWRSKQKATQTNQEKKRLELVIGQEEAEIKQLKQVA